jgi:hypothetical protein
MTPSVPSCSRSRSLGLHVVRSACCSDSACQDVACSAELTIVYHLGPQHQAFATVLRPLRVYVRSDWVYAIVWQRIVARSQVFSTSRDVFGTEDAGSGRIDCLFEEALVQDLHGPSQWGRKHVVCGHWKICRRGAFVVALVLGADFWWFSERMTQGSGTGFPSRGYSSTFTSR